MISIFYALATTAISKVSVLSGLLKYNIDISQLYIPIPMFVYPSDNIEEYNISPLVTYRTKKKKKKKKKTNRVDN